MPVLILINGGEITRHEDGRCMVYFSYDRRGYRKYIAPGAIVVFNNIHQPHNQPTKTIGMVYDAIKYSTGAWILKTWPIGNTSIEGLNHTHSFLWKHMMMLFEFPLEAAFEDCEHEKQMDGDHTKSFMLVCNATPSERPSLIPIPGRRLPKITPEMIDDPSFEPEDPPRSETKTDEDIHKEMEAALRSGLTHYDVAKIVKMKYGQRPDVDTLLSTEIYDDFKKIALKAECTSTLLKSIDHLRKLKDRYFKNAVLLEVAKM